LSVYFFYQNGRAERKNRHVVELGLTLLAQTKCQNLIKRKNITFDDAKLTNLVHLAQTDQEFYQLKDLVSPQPNSLLETPTRKLQKPILFFCSPTKRNIYHSLH
jgi:hypothetical protein